MPKSADAFRSIGEVAALIGVAPHVLRYWETQFPQLAPVKRADGRRYYRPDDIRLAAGLCEVMREDGMTARGAARLMAPDKGASVRARGAERLAAMEAAAPHEAAPKRSRKAESGARSRPATPRKAAAMPLFDDADTANTGAVAADAGPGEASPPPDPAMAEALPPEAGSGIADLVPVSADDPVAAAAVPAGPVTMGLTDGFSALPRIEAIAGRLRALPPGQRGVGRLRPAATRLRALLDTLG